MLRPDRTVFGSLTVFVCLLTLPTLVSAQTPDLSGRWDLRKERSILTQSGGGGGGRRGGGGGGASLTIRMTITQKGDTLTIARVDEGPRGDRERYTETFIANGEPTTIETPSGEVTVKAEWQRNSLVVERSRSMAMRAPTRNVQDQARTMTMTNIETYTLHEEGKWMMVFVQSGGRMPSSPMTLNYEKTK